MVAPSPEALNERAAWAKSHCAFKANVQCVTFAKAFMYAQWLTELGSTENSCICKTSIIVFDHTQPLPKLLIQVLMLNGVHTFKPCISNTADSHCRASPQELMDE
eukprot:gnl/MRDRNA2_/MRDRNA2_501316_c0_seq1.p1 gnl/MRDRNA2_/MRDRNA2_501316_c0~~gnl/MRDRNA2_/MRDRNA2_501316_c0_seq1.p1  ORF type:complete len:116 (-),score=7.47 gnl/MRDRNA2_/MRDRNA2_501316_c0_seq1:29-343(-)